MKKHEKYSLIDAESSQDLLRILNGITPSVPLRTKGRTTERCEIRAICHFLHKVAESGLFSYPLRIVHDDRPDFQIHDREKSIGIEITEFIQSDKAWFNARAEKETP